MARPLTHSDTLTFRLDPESKATLAEKALAESKPVGEILRELVRAFVEQERRYKFVAEAQRQSLECASRAADSHSDEAAVRREMEGDLQFFAEEWK